jgi:MerR family transcriptional regulator, light-induced transcriptional regulator
MAIYSIRDLEKLTGIKKHTIRIWEQRYNLIQPQRTDTNIRYYTDDQLRLLFNVALLNRNGYKINKLANMPHEQIAVLVKQISDKGNNSSAKLDALTLAMLNLDERAFENVFMSHLDEFGFKSTMTDLIYPTLENLKALWITRSITPAHEKFITHLIRRKLLRVIDESPVHTERESQPFILYLPESESQELTLLFVYYLLRERGCRVIYLGGYSTVNDIRDACVAVPPGYVFTIIDTPLPRQSVQNYLNQAALAVGGNRLLVTGSQLAQHHDALVLPDNVSVLDGLSDTLAFLDRIK